MQELTRAKANKPDQVADDIAEQGRQWLVPGR